MATFFFFLNLQSIIISEMRCGCCCYTFVVVCVKIRFKGNNNNMYRHYLFVIWCLYIPSVEMIETSGTWRIQRRIQRRIEFVDLLLLIATTGRQQMARSTRSTSSSYTDELIIASATSDPLPVRPEFTCWIWKQWIKRLLISLHIESSTHTQREETNKRWQIHVVVGLFHI